MSQFDVLDALEHIRAQPGVDDAVGIDRVVEVTREQTDWDAPKKAVYDALSRLFKFGWVAIELRIAEDEDGRRYTKEYYKANTEEEDVTWQITA